jgi:hypothetical protein
VYQDGVLELDVVLFLTESHDADLTRDRGRNTGLEEIVLRGDS